jgi:hemoglobin-like flavoprotein
MGPYMSCALNIVSIAPVDPLRPKRLTRAQIQLVDKYLMDFRYYETSTLKHRKIAGDFWNEAFFEAASSRSGNSTSRRSNNASQSSSRLTQLYDVFYNYLDHNAPSLRHVFRSSMHVRTKVLVHISAGMRTLLESSSLEDEVIPLVRTHIRSGVKLEYHNPLGNALLFSMKEVSGALWTPEVDDAWRRLFSHCCVLLLTEHKKLAEQAKKNENGPTLPSPGSPALDDIYHGRRPMSIKERFSSSRSGSEAASSSRSAPAPPGKQNAIGVPSPTN